MEFRQNKNKDEKDGRKQPAQPIEVGPKTKEQKEQERIAVWGRMDKLITELYEMIMPKRNLHLEIKGKACATLTAYHRLREWEEKCGGTRLPPSPTATVMQKESRARTVSESTSVMDTEVEEDTAGSADQPPWRPLRAARRKRTSPDADVKATKKTKGDTGVRQSPKPMEQTPRARATAAGWQTVGARRQGRSIPGPLRETKRELNPPRNMRSARRKRPSRSDALIVRPKDKAQYSEVLKKIKAGITPETTGSCIDKIRRTATGDMLIILEKDSMGQAEELQKSIAGFLEGDADVISKGPQEDLEIRDISEDTSKEEVVQWLQKKAGEDCGLTTDAIKSLRNFFGGTQIALVTVPDRVATKIIGENGKVRIELVNCRVRRVERPVKCFRCWHYGHLATRCKSAVDRSKLCTKCGEEGHQIKDCSGQAKCAICTKADGTEACAHVAGSSKCPVFREALQKIQNRR